MIKEIKQFLTTNPREKEPLIEYEMLKMSIDYYHIVSLLWEKTTRKFTKEFVIYKTQEILEIFTNNLNENDIEAADRLIEQSLNVFQQSNSLDDLFALLGVEFDNYPGCQDGLSIDLKIGALFRILELSGFSKSQILEKYN